VSAASVVPAAPIDARLHAALTALARSAGYVPPPTAERWGPLTHVALAPSGALVGFVTGHVVLDEAELHFVVVAPEARRSGLGRGLLAAFEAAAEAAGAARLFLEVHEANAPARALYRARGWDEVGRRRGYYADGGAAVLMARSRAHPPDVP
jgi:ribosomal-protein-alanine N-acetyltransferase